MSRGQGGGQKAGAYLGGIRTVEDLRCRCRVDEVTGCWHWSLAIVGGAPSVHWVDADGVRRKARGRRASLLIAGRKIAKGHVAFARPVCTSYDCVNPDHSKSGDRDEEGKAIASSGIWKNSPVKIAAAKAVAKKKRKLTDAQAAEIRSSDLSGLALSKQYGLSPYAIWCLRSGRSYKANGFSIFSAANDMGSKAA